MAAPDSTIWSMERHTQAKHEILRRYLGAWLPILIHYCGHARIVDGFAGPGEYEGGEPGSPLIVLQTLLNHPSSGVQAAIRKGTVEIIFIERDQKRSDYLRELLAKQKLMATLVRPSIITGTFTTEMEKLLTKMEQQKVSDRPVPTFVFIDPFGYSHTPLTTITRIMHQPMCEVLVNFMAEEINRFLTVDYRTKEQYYDHLFGTDEWRQIAQQTITPTERWRLQHDLYQRQLLNAAGAKYVRSFRMRNKHNTTDYFLFFCTNSIKGLLEMKRAMWKVDPSGNFEFSDFSNPYQPLLLNEPNYADLQARLISQFKGQTVTVGEIEQYVQICTPYLNCVKYGLKPLEQAAKIRVIDPFSRRKNKSFSDDHMQIAFL